MASTVWRGFINFGLISIPVRLFRAARAERVNLRRLYRAEPGTRDRDNESEESEEAKPAEQPGPRRLAERDSDAEPVYVPAKQGAVRDGDGEVVPKSAVVKGYEYEKNRFVALDADELKNLAPKTATEMEILEFVKLDEVDPVYFETSYYVRPEEAGQKAYALLYRSLQLSGLVAAAKFAMHNREHVVILRPGKKGLIAHTMFFASEVRAEEEYATDTTGLKEKELKLAQTLISSLAASFEPEKYHDTYREQLEALIQSKVQARPEGKAPAAAPVKAKARVVDIAEALQKSLAALKKPPATEKHPPAKAKKAAARASK
ncbi:MAG TPA: Ku protein [Bryobacteraceae bacterium]|jgi:DNA end-binding protein Ku|nr:Ku protein [Bryobacteraceae bacterium]